jgi:hypothetical protein
MICLMEEGCFSTTRSKSFIKRCLSKVRLIRGKRYLSYIPTAISTKDYFKRCKGIAQLEGSSMPIVTSMRASGVKEREKGKES